MNAAKASPFPSPPNKLSTRATPSWNEARGGSHGAAFAAAMTLGAALALLRRPSLSCFFCFCFIQISRQSTDGR